MATIFNLFDKKYTLPENPDLALSNETLQEHKLVWVLEDGFKITKEFKNKEQMLKEFPEARNSIECVSNRNR